MKYILLALAVAIIVATVLPLVRKPHWWIRMFDFPRAQIAVFGVLVLVATILLLPHQTWWEWGIPGLLAAAVVYQGMQMLPYTRLYPKQVKQAREVPEGRAVRLVVTNVKMDNHDAELWLEVMHEADPDVLIALETDAWWIEHARMLHPRYPYRVEAPQDDGYGMFVYSRCRLRHSEVRRMVDEAVPSVWAVLEVGGGQPVRLVAIHPRPTRPDVPQDSDQRDAELVLVARDLRDLEDGLPVIVAGDLNDVAWSHSTRLFQRLSGLLDPRVGRGRFSTFHAEYPIFRWPLDHVFHSEDFTVNRLRLLEPVGSDHYPILVELVLEQDAPARQRELTPESDDLEEAQDTLDEHAQRGAEETPAERRERERKDR
jgi:endonuclease/exonuclease/phosphatase (EEP) superfamily protein YafD